ncbi:hypothetical protein BC938DRAFT_483853 [Jimgerdemannia flammicorona]|uniref:Uncharacterized protein n=1 Tax=Jimgerdemannia flammicorona TaxID=994334 RepID=A0A433QB93_9FUNG|nr:hypothetical protein BC938DRAFT_483853 [Jimgerdemannia flammicorona]
MLPFVEKRICAKEKGWITWCDHLPFAPTSEAVLRELICSLIFAKILKRTSISGAAVEQVFKVPEGKDASFNQG